MERVFDFSTPPRNDVFREFTARCGSVEPSHPRTRAGYYDNTPMHFNFLCTPISGK